MTCWSSPRIAQAGQQAARRITEWQLVYQTPGIGIEAGLFLLIGWHPGYLLSQAPITRRSYSATLPIGSGACKTGFETPFRRHAAIKLKDSPPAPGIVSSGPRSKGRPRIGGLRPCRSASGRARPDRRRASPFGQISRLGAMLPSLQRGCVLRSATFRARPERRSSATWRGPLASPCLLLP